MSATIGVLALQGDVRQHREMLEASGVDTLAVRRASELDRVDGIVLPGGESTTMAKLARTFDVLDPLRARVRDGLPAFGTCAGMILLADRIEDGAAGQETIGGLDVVVRRNAFGRQVDSFEADLDVEGFTEPFHALFIRAPWVEKTGADVAVVARVATGDAVGRIVAVRQGHLLATSFHPEITGDDRFHRLFVEQVQAAATKSSGKP
jgi:pyridoxal 5'-phosphate synthase pdxT subunit